MMDRGEHELRELRRLYTQAQQEIAECKQREKKLLQAQAEGERTFNAVPDLVAILDVDYHILRVNTAMAEQLQLAPEACQGQTCYQLIHEIDQPPSFCPHAQLLKDGHEHKEEVYVRRWGKHFLVTASPLHDSEGRLVGSVHVARDITEHKWIEESLSDSEELYRSVITIMSEGIVVQDAIGTIITCNPAAGRILGIPYEHLIGGNFIDFCRRAMHEDGSPFLRDMHPAMITLRTGAPQHNGVMGIHKPDGTLTWISINSQPMLQEKDKEPYGVVVSFSDITERKQAEELRAKERNLLQALIDNVPDLVYVKDTQGRFLLINKANMRSLGVAAVDAAVGKTDFDFFPGHLSQQYFMDEQALFASGQPLINHEEPYIEPQTGRTRWFLTTKVPFHDRQGNIIGLVGINHDITERKQFEEQLKELNVSKDKFFSIIAHDLRGPLSSLHELTNMLVANIEEYSKESLINMLMMQRDTAKEVTALLENLLTWSRMQRGLIHFAPEEVPLKAIIVRNIDLFTPPANQKQITLNSVIPENMSAFADVNMINTVIRNLISNALKFTHPGGTITVTVQKKETVAEVSVADTGIGIDAQHLPNLFRIDAKQTRFGTAQEKGTGLGLILCKEFVERNGGEIRIESEVGKGSTFTFTLPLFQSRQQADEIASILPPQKTLKILFEAAIDGDIARFRQHLEQLQAEASYAAPFVNRLSQLADEFKFSQIQELLRKYITQN